MIRLWCKGKHGSFGARRTGFEYLLADVKYTKDILQEAVDNSYSVSGVLRHLGLRPAGGTHAHISRTIKKFELDTSHFKGAEYNPGWSIKTADDILTVLPEGSNRAHRYQLKRAMIEKGINYICAECGLLPEWNNKELTLEIDHIDGNWHNNLLGNLRFMCPNCHTQTETYAKYQKNK